MAEAEPKRSMAVKCEKHGLHYDSATQTGCVICRREAGGMAPARAAVAVPAPPAGTGPVRTPDAAAAGTAVAAVAAGAATPRGAMGPALLVAGLLVAAASVGLYALHSAVADYVKGMFGGGQPQLQTYEKDEQLERVQKELEELNRPGPAPEGLEPGVEPGFEEPGLEESGAEYEPD